MFHSTIGHCPLNLKLCGSTCIPSADKCCNGGIGACNQSRYCLLDRCCPIGEARIGSQRLDLYRTFLYASNLSNYDVNFSQSIHEYKTYGEKVKSIDLSTTITTATADYDDNDDDDEMSNITVTPFAMSPDTEKFEEDEMWAEIQSRVAGASSSRYITFVNLLRLVFFLMAVPAI